MRSSQPTGSNAFSILESLLMLVLLAVFAVVLTSLALRAMQRPDDTGDLEIGTSVPTTPHPAFEPPGKAPTATP